MDEPDLKTPFYGWPGAGDASQQQRPRTPAAAEREPGHLPDAQAAAEPTRPPPLPGLAAGCCDGASPMGRPDSPLSHGCLAGVAGSEWDRRYSLDGRRSNSRQGRFGLAAWPLQPRAGPPVDGSCLYRLT